MLVICPQNRPSETVRLRQGELKFGAHDLERTLLRVDASEQRHTSAVSLLVRGAQIQLNRVRVLEVYFANLLVDLLQVQAGDDRRGSLVEIVPDF